MTPAISRSEIHSTLASFDEGYRHFLLETPLLKAPGAFFGLPCAEVWLKLEQLQVSGSFKARGMLKRLLANAVPSAGAIIASGGNAGIAAAAAARMLGHSCEVFVPRISSAAKQERLRALGAQLRVMGDDYAQALQACLERQAQSGALLMHAYDQHEVVLGAGTLAAEIDRQAQQAPDSILISVGGGGLIAGVASWYADTATRVIALEPENAPTLHAARAAGAPVDVSVSGLAADALGARRIGSIAWPITQRGVQASYLLSDAAIREAQLWLWHNMKLAVEPAAALGLAALRSGVYTPQAQDRVCLVLCGANLDLNSLHA